MLEVPHKLTQLILQNHSRRQVCMFSRVHPNFEFVCLNWRVHKARNIEGPIEGEEKTESFREQGGVKVEQEYQG